jgi:hypothetical protein
MTANERQQLPVTIPVLASLAARGVLTLAIAAALSACAALLQSGARPQIASTADYVSSQLLAAPVGVWPAESWCEAYGDPQLNSLVAEGLAGCACSGIAVSVPAC